MERKDKNNSLVRRILWEAYNKKCFYCKEPISFNNFQIDHLIPKSLGNEQAIETYELSENFELDSYYNLVPTCFPCNNRKRDNPYPKNQILLLSNDIKKKIPKILDLENKFTREDKRSKISAVISTSLGELDINDILMIIKDQEIKFYQKEIINDAIELNKKETEFLYYFKLGTDSFSNEDFSTALLNFDSALKIKPDDEDALNNKGAALSNAGDYLDALIYFQKSLEINPEYIIALVNYGKTLFKLNEYNSAIEKLKKALELDPQALEAWYMIGEVLSAKKQDEDAVEAYRNALKIDPDNISTLVGLGAALSNSGELNKALPYFEEVLKKEPNNLTVLINKGITLRKLNRDIEAIGIFKEVLHIDPTNLKALFNLARSYSKVNETNKSLTALEKVNELDPSYLTNSLMFSDFNNISI